MPPEREFTLWEKGCGQVTQAHGFTHSLPGGGGGGQTPCASGAESHAGPTQFWSHSHFRERGLSSWYKREGCNLGAQGHCGSETGLLWTA